MEPEISTAGVVLAALAFFGSFEVLRRMFIRWWSSQPILPREPRNSVPWSGLEVLGSVIVYILAMQVVPLAMGLLLPAPGDEEATIDSSLMLGLSLANLAAVAGSLLILLGISRARRSDLGLPASALQAVNDLKIGALGFLASLIPVFAIQLVATRLIDYEHPLIDMLQQPSADAKFWLIAALSAVIAAPIAEEYFFRLVLQGWLERMFAQRTLPATPPFSSDDSTAADETTPWQLAGDEQRESPYASPLTAESLAANENAGESSQAEHSATADTAGVELVVMPLDEPLANNPWRRIAPVVISSAAFALMHLGQGPAPIPLFVLALGLGYIYQQTHRILPCIALHALFNGYSLAMLALMR